MEPNLKVLPTSERPEPSPEYGSVPSLPSPAEHARPAVQLTDQTNLLPFRKIIVCFLGLALCIVVSTLDSVIVATALPTISSTFDAGSVVSWVPSAFLLTSTCFQPLYGRFSDIFGRKTATTVAMLVFMFGNLLSGFSKTIVELIVFRGLAGAGEGGIISMVQIVISDIVSLRERGKYQGFLGGIIALGYAIGPVLGGALAQEASWRWCFWISIPVSMCAISVVIFVLPLKPVHGDMKAKLLAIDYLGAILSLVSCTLILLPLIWGGVTFPWNSPIVLATLSLGVVISIIFCIWEWRGARLPIVPMYIFKHITVTGVYIVMFINGFVTFSSIYYLPQYFQAVLGYSPIGAGIFLIPLLVGQMLLSWIAGIVVTTTGRYRNIIHAGFTIWSIGCGLISTITMRSSKARMVLYMLLAGSGAGQTLQTTTVAAQASVPRKDMSVVTGFRNFVRSLGSTLALALGSTIINNSLRTSMNDLALPHSIITAVINNPSKLSDPSIFGLSSATADVILDRGYTHGFRVLFILNASLTAVATLASVFMIRHHELTRAGEEPPRGDVATTAISQTDEASSKEKVLDEVRSCAETKGASGPAG